MNAAHSNANSFPSTDAYNEFVQAIELIDVNIQAERCVVLVPPTQINPATSGVQLVFNYDWMLDKEGCSFVVLVTGEFHSTRLDNNKAEVELKATYVLTYKINAAKMAVEDNLFDLFARINATFHAVPYFREFFQATLARFRVPTFLLPMLKPGYAIEAHRTKQI